MLFVTSLTMHCNILTHTQKTQFTFLFHVIQCLFYVSLTTDNDISVLHIVICHLVGILVIHSYFLLKPAMMWMSQSELSKSILSLVKRRTREAIQGTLNP